MAPDNSLRSDNRRALLGVYAALDRTGKLVEAFRQLGVEFDGPLEPYLQLQKAAENLDQQDHPIHRIHLAGAAMKVLRDPHFPPPGGSDYDELRPVVDHLVAPSHRGTDIVGEVYSRIERASGEDRFRERWKQVNDQPGDMSSPLDPSLSAIADSRVKVTQRPRINTGLLSVEGEVVSRVETSFAVKRPDLDLQKLAPAILPHNWPRCSDFFCELSRREDRDRDVPGATGGDLSADQRHWRGVYQEKVGGCPGGWFPDTFLVFTWDYYPPNQMILRYELAPRRANDRTVLRIDEGYIQVNRVTDGYEVSTLKYLLFDDKFISGGGQTLASLAPQIGWLEQSINQFGSCAELPDDGAQPGIPPDIPGARDEMGAGLMEVLRRAETNLQQTATSADEQFNKVVSKIRDGKYGLNDFVTDWGEAALCAMRDTARAWQGTIDYARESVELATEFLPKRGTRS